MYCNYFRICMCPPKLREICKHAKTVECKDVEEIIEALSDRGESKIAFSL